MNPDRRPLLLMALVLIVLCAAVAGGAVFLAVLFRRANPGLRAGEFQGHFTAGFEVSSFVPCGSPAAPGYGQGYWLSADADVNFYQQYDQAIAGLNPPPGGYTTVYVRFKGELSPPGSYGHLGAYSHEILVTDLLEIDVNGTCQ
jgi:hypothetical protein